MKTKRVCMNGNEATTHVAYAFSEAAYIFPITPSSAMAELAEKWCSEGKKNIFNHECKVIQMQSEGGAAGAVHGSCSMGTLTTTFTASQGLLLMIPNMYKIAGELLPCVFHVSARAIAGQALSIFGDHSDVMATRQTGFAFLTSGHPQECMDMALVAHLSSLRSSVPFVHFFDGFVVSHQYNDIEVIDYEDIKKLVDEDALERFRDRGLSPLRPIQRGTAEGPEVYFQLMEAANPSYEVCPRVVEEEMRKVSELTGRSYSLFEYSGHPEAERVVVTMCASHMVVLEVVETLMKKGEKVGVLNVRLYRPWSKQHFLDQLPKTVEKIAVLDRTKENGSLGEPLFLDVVGTVATSGRPTMPKIVGGRYGLASKDFTPGMAAAVYRNLAQANPKHGFTLGIQDDVSHTSLEPEKHVSNFPEGTRQCVFFGMGGDGTVGICQESIKLINENTPLHVTSNSFYDAFKSNGLTVSHLRFGPEPFKCMYWIQEADIVACHSSRYPAKFGRAMLKNIKQGGKFLLNCSWSTTESVESHFPAALKRLIAERDVSLYTINASKEAMHIGLQKKISTIMQAAFFKIAEIVPFEEVREILKNTIIRRFLKRKGQGVVDMNIRALDAGANMVQKIEYDKNKWAQCDRENPPSRNVTVKDPSKSKDLTTFIDEIFKPMSSLEGDEIPVSKFRAGGEVPMGHTQYNKRGLALKIPVWDEIKCTQCNKCAMVCPHAVIRPFLLSDEEIENGPSTLNFQRCRSSGPASNYNYRITISSYDCTGCTQCSKVCEDDALHMVDTTPGLMARENKNWEYCLDVPNRADLFDRYTLKGAQFHEPMVQFSGACDGCGETAYIKLATQLFGERMVIANATGCTTIWGGTYGENPYATNRKGHGATWANSLFEDNAEYGLGMNISNTHRREGLKETVKQILDDKTKQKGMSPEIVRSLAGWLETADRSDCNEYAVELQDLLKAAVKTHYPSRAEYPELHQLWRDRTLFTKVSQWIIGGDGWAYDIGYGGLDHVVSMGENINILVLDTEMYSNTGGQCSKSTPLSAIAKFAAHGKRRPKKDLGAICMQYKDIYVASVCLPADMGQCTQAFIEAEKYPGTSIIIAYALCEMQDIEAGLQEGVEECKNAVNSGYWPLYRFNPAVSEGANPFTLDHGNLSVSIKEFLRHERRFTNLKKIQPEQSEGMLDALDQMTQKKFKEHKELSKSHLKQQQGTAGEPLFDCVFLYISDTGNAERVARGFCKDAKTRGMSVDVMAADNFDPNVEFENTQHVVVVASTTGQGLTPENGRQFLETITGMKGQLATLQTTFAVFGLGDSSYVYFNECGKAIHKALAETGLKPVANIGLGDDQDSEKYNTALEDWEVEMWAGIKAPEPTMAVPTPLFETKTLSSPEKEYNHKANIMPEDTALVPLTVVRKLTPDTHDRDIRHFEIDLSQSKLRYSLLGNASIYPENTPDNVQQFLEWFSLNEADYLSVAPLSPDLEGVFPKHLSAWQMASQLLDFGGRATKKFFKSLLPFCSSEAHRDEIIAITSDPKKWKEVVQIHMPTMFDAIRKYTHPSLFTLNHCLDSVPPIKPRLYSIASAPRKNPTKMELCIVKEDWTCKSFYSGKEEYRGGLCTTFLMSRREGDLIRMGVRGPSISLPRPSQLHIPVTLAALGTGLAPVRAYIQEREALKKQGKESGPFVVYFGCRYQKKDFLYGDELKHWAETGVITNLRLAFSRDQDHKIYITHKIAEDAKDIHQNLVKDEGFFYFCGAINSSKSTREAVVGALKSEAGVSGEEAQLTVHKLQLEGRYLSESW